MEDMIYRNISFYKLNTKNYGKDIDPIDIFSHINNLPFDEDGRYLLLNDGNVRLLHVLNTKIPLKIIYGTTRRRNLPLLEKKGISSPLEISDNEGLYEPTHAIIFNNNIIGMENNYYGPRAESLAGYIKKKAPDLVNEVELLPLMRSDFLKYISRIGKIKVVELKVHRDMTKKLEEMNRSVYHALNGLKDTTNAEYIGITLNSTGKKGVKLDWKNRFFNMFRSQEVRDSTSKAFIRAEDNYTNKLNNFNLLEPYLISQKQVIKTDSIHRSVDEKSMFNAIMESYFELRGEIEGITEVSKKSQKLLDEFILRE